jgi:hypothetical protein
VALAIRERGVDLEAHKVREPAERGPERKEERRADAGQVEAEQPADHIGRDAAKQGGADSVISQARLRKVRSVFWREGSVEDAREQELVVRIHRLSTSWKRRPVFCCHSVRSYPIRT